MIDVPPFDLYRARTVSVKNVNSLDADIYLGFTVWVRQRVSMVGVDSIASATGDRMHCMIVLLGGKKLVLWPKGSAGVGHISAQVYLDGVVRREVPGLMRVAWQDTPILDLAEYTKYLAKNQWDVDMVKADLNGLGYVTAQ